MTWEGLFSAHLSQETIMEAVDAAAKATGTDWGQALLE
jgi:hypothetical protein